MPQCICPKCLKSHSIPTKNLGLMGRCTQCKNIFRLEIEPKSLPTLPPTTLVRDEPDAYATVPSSWQETVVREKSSLIDVPKLQEENQGNEFDELEDAQEEPRSMPPTGTLNRRTVNVASLPERPALLALATVYRVSGLILIAVAVFVLCAGMYGFWNPEARSSMPAFILFFVPSSIGCTVFAIIAFATREMILLARSVEERLHEISRNISR